MNYLREHDRFGCSIRGKSVDGDGSFSTKGNGVRMSLLNSRGLSEDSVQQPAPAGIITGSWKQLTDQLNRAMCTMRAIRDFRHQDQIIFPGHLSQGTGRAAVKITNDQELLRLPVYDEDALVQAGKSGAPPVPAQQVAILISRACDSQGLPLDDYHSQPTVLFFYGAEMYLATMLPVVEHLNRCGVNVVVPEYIGYGQSSGDPSQQGCYATAEAALEYLLDRPDIEPGRIILMGCGMGAAVAAELAASHETAGLIGLSPITSMPELLHWRLPQRTVDILVRHKFEASRHIKSVRCPILLVHGSDDQIVPASMSQELALSTRSVCRTMLVESSQRHGAELLDDPSVLASISQFVHDARPRLASTGHRRSAMVMTRPLALRNVPAATDAGQEIEAALQSSSGWRLPAASARHFARYTKPVTRAS